MSLPVVTKGKPSEVLLMLYFIGSSDRPHSLHCFAALRTRCHRSLLSSIGICLLELDALSPLSLWSIASQLWSLRLVIGVIPDSLCFHPLPNANIKVSLPLVFHLLFEGESLEVTG